MKSFFLIKYLCFPWTFITLQKQINQTIQSVYFDLRINSNVFAKTWNDFDELTASRPQRHLNLKRQPTIQTSPPLSNVNRQFKPPALTDPPPVAEPAPVPPLLLLVPPDVKVPPERPSVGVVVPLLRPEVVVIGAGLLLLAEIPRVPQDAPAPYAPAGRYLSAAASQMGRGVVLAEGAVRAVGVGAGLASRHAASRVEAAALGTQDDAVVLLADALAGVPRPSLQGRRVSGGGARARDTHPVLVADSRAVLSRGVGLLPVEVPPGGVPDRRRPETAPR